MTLLLGLGLAFSSLARPALGESPPPAPVVAAARRSGPIVVDGRADEPAWSTAEEGSGFRQIQPDEGAPASAATRFRVLWDDEAIYVAIDCDEPDEPLLRLGRRDRQVDADAVSVVLDPQRDRRSAYRFTVYAAGQQLDGLHYDDIQLTTDWDAAWESAVARTGTGWSVELRVPLRVLRIPDGVTELGLNVVRTRARRHEDSSWRFTPRGTPGVVSQLGTLTGVAGLHPVRAIELRPYLALFGSLLRPAPGGTAPVEPGACSSFGVADGATARACLGLDFKVGLTSGLALVGAVNPDFGQVEADQRVLNLTTFETLFPEKRPFFLEGLDLFQPPVRMTDWGGEYGGDALQLFYSRRIGASLAPPPLEGGEGVVHGPVARPVLTALKLVGNLGSATVTALSALETRANATVRGADGALREVRVAEAAHSAVVRARLPLGDRGLAGLTATARDPIAAPGARHAYAGAADLILFSEDRGWNLALQLAGSRLAGGAAELQLDGQRLDDGAAGGAASVRASRDAGVVTGFVDVDYLSPRLAVNDLGYARRGNLLRAFGAVALRDVHGGDLWQRASVTLSGREIRTADLGVTLYRDVVLQPEAVLSSFWTVLADLIVVPARGDDRELGDGTPVEKQGGWGAACEVATDATRPVAGSAALTYMGFGSGQQAELTSSLTLRPLPSVETRLELAYTTARGEIRRLRGATTVPEEGGAPVALDPATATETSRLYLFAPQSAEGVSGTLRGSLALSPRLTLQVYAQLYAAGMVYGDALRAVVGPGRPPVRVADLPTARPEDQAVAVDQRQAALDLNLILRWEWRTGSTLYLVYAHDSLGARSLGPGVGLSVSRELGILDAALGVDSLLVKVDLLQAL